MYQTKTFKSKDGLLITGDLHKVKDAKGLILLCHRSHCNRAEYRETAPFFNELGYSCLAIDQRSGMNIFKEVNQTSTLAKQKGLSTGYLDARQDIEAAVDYACNKLNQGKPIILLGSSYSAALALLISLRSDLIRALMLFSPGEHLKGIRLADEIKALKTPCFATAAQKEFEEMQSLFRHCDAKHLNLYRPAQEGFHGSKCMWQGVPGYQGYREAAARFLSSLESQA